MQWGTIQEKQDVLSLYQKFGLNCSCITGIHSDDKSYKQPSSCDISNADWERATGIGIRLGGKEEIRALDIDDFRIRVRDDDDHTHTALHTYATNFFIKKCTQLLGIPEDYEWLIRTPRGWHIVFSAPSIGLPKVSLRASKENLPNVISGNTIRFGIVELLWDGHLVMPPSSGSSTYSRYAFYNQIPREAPLRIDLAKILDFINFYCGTFEYMVDMTDRCCCPIIGDAHLFPNYTYDICWGSEAGFDYEGKLLSIHDNIDLLKECRSSTGYNMLGIQLVKSDLRQNYNVDKNLSAAIKCFRLANDEWGHYNLACLIAIGAMDGSIDDLYRHLTLACSFPNKYKEQLVMLFLAKNKSVEKYAIIDLSTTQEGRIDKIAILVTDSKGHILDRRFLNSDSVMLENMFYGLNYADYIVGYNVEQLVEIIKHECKFTGSSFSYDSNSATGIVHLEGNYIDVFKRPHLNVSTLHSEETDPCRRVYAIKNQMCLDINKGNDSCTF